MPTSPSRRGQSRRRSTTVRQNQPLTTLDESTACRWDPDTYPFSFDRRATMRIENKTSDVGYLLRDVYFLLYGCVCFGLVPITAHILVPHERFLQWYATNIAVLQCEYYFKYGIQGFTIMFVCLVAMVFTGNTSPVEICARNGAGLAVWIIFFIRMSENMLRDAALHMGLLYRGDGDELILVLQQQASSLDRYPQQALRWGLVIEFELFIVIYAAVAIRKFIEIQKLNRSCTNLMNWKLLLRQIDLNTDREGHDATCS